MDTLTDDSTGSWQITTATGSHYLIDLDQRLLRRVPRTSSDAESRLRRDGDILDLVEVVHCQRGDPMLVLINLAVPGVAMTSRETTPVVSITPAAAFPPRP